MSEPWIPAETWDALPSHWDCENCGRRVPSSKVHDLRLCALRRTVKAYTPLWVSFVAGSTFTALLWRWFG